MIDEPIAGIGDFARRLVGMEEYGRCQVRNFWRRFVGDERILDENPGVLADAVAAFDAWWAEEPTTLSGTSLLRPEFRRKVPKAAAIDPVYARAVQASFATVRPATGVRCRILLPPPSS